MKTANLCIALATLLLGSTATAQAWGTKRIKESKNYVTKEIKVDNFTGINLTGSPTVYFTQKAGKPSVKVYTSDNIAEVLNIYEKDGTLYIGFKKGYSVNYTKLDINISAETLNQVNVTGSGEIYLKNGLKTDRFKASVAGSGDIAGNHIRCKQLKTSVAGSGDLTLANIQCTDVTASVAGSGDLRLKEVAANTVTASVAGSGDLTIKGHASEATYSVAGSGDLHASDLIANRVNASVAGSGDIRCHAIDYLKAGTSGSGSIGYKGNPKETDFPKKNIYEL